MKKRIILKNILVSLIIFSFCMPVIAQAFQGQPPPNALPKQRQIFRLLKDLNLTAEQEASMQELQESLKAMVTPLFEELKEMDIYKTLLASDIDESRFHEQVAVSIELESQITQIVSEINLEASKILTAEQRALLLEKIEQRKAQIENIKEWRDKLRSKRRE